MSFKHLFITSFFLATLNLYAQDEGNDQPPPPPPEQGQGPGGQDQGMDGPPPGGQGPGGQKRGGQGQMGGAQGRGGQRPRPPREAMDACKSKKSDDTCSFTGREGKQITGVCGAPDSSHPLACRPPRRQQQE